MILIVTHKEDYTADFLITKLNTRKIPYYRFNCEDIITTDFKFQNNNNFSSQLNSIENYTSVWFRRTKLPEISTSLSQSERTYLLLEYDALLSNILTNISTHKWLSKPDSIYKAENKLYQLKIAKSIGFNIPITLVSNDRKEISEFFKKHNNNLVIKTLNSGRIKGEEFNRLIYTSKVRKEDIDRIDSFDITPFILQTNIEKDYEIRVTIVDNTIFAAKVNSQENETTKIDWRREKMLFSEYKLPDQISAKCIDLVRSLNLSFGAIDLIKTKDDQYYFLEINPNGQWAWVEIDTKLNISESIINFLSSDT